MLMFAVSVTDWPALEGFLFDAIVIAGVAVAALTLCNEDPVPGSNEASPSYRASIVWTPSVRPAVVSEALPNDSTLLPTSVAPSKNRTIPPGAPAAGAAAATFAVKVMVWSRPDGAGLDATDMMTPPRATVSVPFTYVTA